MTQTFKALALNYSYPKHTDAKISEGKYTFLLLHKHDNTHQFFT